MRVHLVDGTYELFRQYLAPRRFLTTLSVVLVTMVAQGILGYVQYAQGVPELLVGFHVAGAVLVFGSVQWLQFEMRVPVDPVAARSSATRELELA